MGGFGFCGSGGTRRSTKGNNESLIGSRKRSNIDFEIGVWLEDRRRLTLAL